MSSAAADADSRNRQAVLRFATAVTAAFLFGEAMDWFPSFVGAALAVALLANLPVRPTPKLALVLVLVMSVSAFITFVLSRLLLGMPMVLFGSLALLTFLCFHTMLTGGPKLKLPTLLLLICMVTIPVVMMALPAYGDVMPKALIRGMVLAMLAIGAVYLVWPLPPAPVAPPPAQSGPTASPLTLAVLATAVVVPLMLVYLMYGIADALPVLVATVLLVVNFDPRRSSRHALALILGNFAGGMMGMLVHTLLIIMPTLLVLGLLLFAVTLVVGRRVAAGGEDAAVAVVACNAMLIILGSAIDSGPGSFALWMTRLFQFMVAGAFAVGMMNLVWYLPAGWKGQPLAGQRR